MSCALISIIDSLLPATYSSKQGWNLSELPALFQADIKRTKYSTCSCTTAHSMHSTVPSTSHQHQHYLHSLTLHIQSGKGCLWTMSVLSKTHVCPPVFKLDISDYKPAIGTRGHRISDSVCFIVHDHFLCALDRPNGCVDTICTNKVPCQ